MLIYDVCFVKIISESTPEMSDDSLGWNRLVKSNIHSLIRYQYTHLHLSFVLIKHFSVHMHFCIIHPDTCQLSVVFPDASSNKVSDFFVLFFCFVFFPCALSVQVSVR